MYYYLYQITNKVNGKIYVGVHSTPNIDDGYLGSGKHLCLAIDKHGKDMFDKTILRFFNSETEMYAAEAELVNSDFVNRKDVYNLREGGLGGWSFVHSKKLHHGFTGKKHTAESKQKISESSRDRVVSEETKVKQSVNNFARRNPEKQREHAKKAALKSNEARSKDSIARISLAAKSQWLAVENVKCPHCAKIGRGGTMKRWHFDRCKNKAPLDQLE